MLNYVFLLGGGGGGGRGSENKYVWRYDEIMIFLRFGGHFYQFGAFLRSRYRFGKCFWGC